MAALTKNAITLLSSTPSVDMKTAASTTLFTVPVGVSCIIDSIVIRGASASLAGGTSYSFTNWRQTVSLAANTGGATKSFTLVEIDNTSYTISTTGTAIQITVTTGSTAACTATIDLFGYLFQKRNFMPLIGSPIPPPAKSVIQAQLKSQLLVQMQMSFRRLSLDFEDLFTKVWENQDLTPQEVMDAFGTDAVQLFILAQATETYLNTILPGTISATPPLPYAINENGTVTINPPPPESQKEIYGTK